MVINSKIWCPQNAALLKQLREDAGFDQLTLATLHAISINQLKQLEEGGDKAFYSPAIKFDTGKKILAYFGRDTVQKKLDDDDLALSDESKDLVNIANSSSVKKIEFSSKKFEIKEITQAIEEQKRYSYKLLGFLFFFISLISWFVYSRNADINIPPLRNEDSASVQKASVSIQPIAKDEPIKAETEFLKDKSFDEKKALVERFQCKWDNEPTKLTVNLPSKPGNYLHLTATETSNACVLDADKQLTVLRLTAQEGRTIKGRQPFQVYSPDLTSLKIFYQGSLVKLPPQLTRNILLTDVRQDKS